MNIRYPIYEGVYRILTLYIVFLWLGCAYFANLYQNDCKYV